MAALNQQTESALYLMAEDNPHDAEIFSIMLAEGSNGKFGVECVGSFKAVLKELDHQSFSGLIMDMGLPDSNGIEKVREISTQYPNLPIVILTGNDDQCMAEEALEVGAQDYLSKNEINPASFCRALRYANKRKSLELDLKASIEKTNLQNAKLDMMAKHDILTGLPNRTYINQALDKTIKRATRNEQSFALLYFDLNGFKQVNDSYGHDAGDVVLKTIADRVKASLRATDTIGRLGGDEFVVISDLIENSFQAHLIAQTISDVIEMPINYGDHVLTVSGSVGIAIYPDSDNIEDLMKHADLAMYEAKKSKDTGIQFYTRTLQNKYRRKLELESHLPLALARDEIYPLYQPIIDSSTNRCMGIECLARWNSMELGAISPNEFIYVAEQSHLMNRITDVILKKLGEMNKKLRMSGVNLDKYSVNICGNQILESKFPIRFKEQLEVYQLKPENVCIEITERQLIDNMDRCKEHLEQLKEWGIAIALDDFGTGFASFTHLKQLPIDIIKLDRMLIRDIDFDKQNYALSAGIIEMAHLLDKQVVAEGVERDQELETLKQLGCDQIQGYLMSKPLPQTMLLSELQATQGSLVKSNSLAGKDSYIFQRKAPLTHS